VEQDLERPKMKVVGEPDEEKPHVRFEVAGDGNQDKVQGLRHSQRKQRANGSPSPKSQASSPDPTTRPATTAIFNRVLLAKLVYNESSLASPQAGKLMAVILLKKCVILVPR
jgi:hypothetical protein